MRGRVSALDPFATLNLSDGSPSPVHGHAAWRRTLEAQSSGANVFFRINSRFESDIASDGALVGHRNLSNDSASAKYQAVVSVDAGLGHVDRPEKVAVEIPPAVVRDARQLSLLPSACVSIDA